jgi:hypothetical protein
MLRHRILSRRQKRHVRPLLIRQRLPNPTQQPARPLHLNRKHPIRIREPENIRVPTTDRDLMRLTPV